MGNEVEEIKAKLDIADLLAEYIKLVPAGTNFKALCPFHNEKTPSLMISREKQIFKCFGCGAGGDAFEFLMKIEGVEFPEAKQILARKAGVVLKDFTPQDTSQKSRLLAVMALAAKYYHQVLLQAESAKAAREYLERRGLTEETIIDWQLGYSPDGWSSLSDFLRSRKFSDQEIFLAGLTIKKKSGFGFVDRFRGRIMFPLADVGGQVIAFTARVSPEREATEQMGKYVNSPQTPIYDKSRVVFALDKAKLPIKSADAAVIVEGQMDAITAHQAGFKNVVASSGTALTLEQFKLIKRQTNNFLFALDADLAGQKAIDQGDKLAKALNLYIVESQDAAGHRHAYIDPHTGQHINVKVVEIIGAKDPDELIRKNPDQWRTAVAQAKPVMDYYFDQAVAGVNPGDLSSQLAAVRRLLPEINKLNNRLEIDHWLKRLAQKLSVSESILREELAKVPKITANQRPTNDQPVANQPPIIPRDRELLRRILALAIKYPALLPPAVTGLAADYFTDRLSLDLYKRLVLFYNTNINSNSQPAVDKPDFDLHRSFKDYLSGENTDRELLGLLDEAYFLAADSFAEIDDKAATEELTATSRIIKNDYLQSSVNRLNQQLREAEASADTEKIMALSRELAELLRQKNNQN